MFIYPKITTSLVNKNDLNYHIKKASNNGWTLKQVEQHNSEKELLLVTYTK